MAVAEQSELRPTPNRVRETVFNWLAASLPGANCLDLFAGTGALAYESLSRGAATVTMVERDPALATLLNQNKSRLAADAADVIQQDAIEFLAQCAQSFDLIFLDPPFNQGLVAQAAQGIRQYGLLVNKGMIYIESEPGLSLPDGLITHKQKTSGQVQYGLYSLTV